MDINNLSRPPFEKSVLIDGEWVESDDLLLSAETDGFGNSVWHLELRFTVKGDVDVAELAEGMTIGWELNGEAVVYSFDDLQVYYSNRVNMAVTRKIGNSGVMYVSPNNAYRKIGSISVRGFTKTTPDRKRFN